jgi:hypothetical protein
MTGRAITALAFGLAMLWLAGASPATAQAANWARSGTVHPAASPNFPPPLGPTAWFFQNVQLSDGGTVSGSFVYDQSTNTYSNIDVTTTTGGSRTGAHYTTACVAPACDGVPPDQTEVLLLTNNNADQTGQSALALFFTGIFGGPGLAHGPRIDISNSSANVGAGLEADCSDATCDGPTGTGRSTTAGFVDAPSLAPTLSEWAMILFALAMAGGGVFLVVRGRAMGPFPR